MGLFDAAHKVFQATPSTGPMPAYDPTGVAGQPWRAQIQDWRGQRPQFDEATMDPAMYHQSMQDWRGMRPQHQRGGNIAGGVPVAPGQPQGFPTPPQDPRSFASGLMSSIGKYMPPGWGM